MLLALIHILEFASALMPQSVLAMLGSGGSLVAVAVLVLVILGLLGYLTVRKLTARKPDTSSGKRAFERLSRRV